MYALFDLDDTVHDKAQSLKACAESMHKKFLITGLDADDFMEEFVRENCIIQPNVNGQLN